MAIEFKLNERKAVEAVLWFIEEKKVSDMYAIFKMLFAAEKYHLNKYGRPITGGIYMAMEHGTVPKWLYFDACNMLNVGFAKVGTDFVAEKPCVKDFFSETDIEGLDHGYEEYKGMGFHAIRDKNHKEPAWEKYWKLRGAFNYKEIPFEEFIEENWLREELSWKSHFMVI
ncbi:MAG: SocA family protein [Fibromonadaceae bacterium]|jgi:uncharacterized phage-associated protein|nr:SocA family protein [Fibromonadaceae bacterium]